MYACETMHAPNHAGTIALHRALHIENVAVCRERERERHALLDATLPPQPHAVHRVVAERSPLHVRPGIRHASVVIAALSLALRANGEVCCSFLLIA